MLFPPLSADTVAAARQAHAATLHTFAGKDFAALCANITAALQDDAHIPLCEEHNGRMFHFLQNAEFPKGVYRAAASPLYRAGAPDWQIIFSVADFDAVLGDDVCLTGIAHCETAPHKVLLTLAPGGADAAYTLEFDIDSGTIAADGFHFPLGKNTVHWRDENSVWVAPAWAGEACTRSGYPRAVYLLRRGENFSAAEKILQAADDDLSAYAVRYLDAQGAPLDLAVIEKNFFDADYFPVHHGKTGEKIPLPQGAELCGYLGGFLLLRLREDWTRHAEKYLSGSLIAVKYSRGQLGKTQILFAPSAAQSLVCVETSRSFVLVHYLDNVCAHFAAFRLHNDTWHTAAAPEIAAKSTEITDQPYGGDVFYFLAEDLTTPPTLYAWDAKWNELCVMRRRTAAFDTQGIELKQFSAISSDGTPIPYFWCGSRAAPDVPTVVYFYGGFGVSELPHYLPLTGKYWLEQGGAWVIANVRGGSEFGPDWHHAAQRENKYRSVEDLLAVVRDLHTRRLASPAHTAVQGGSNGGLIAAAAYCRQHNDFAAAVCEVPLADMLHYPEYGAGASWAEEYGDPADARFTAALRALSPVENLPQNSHCALLVTADLADDRVHPHHALKLFQAAAAANPDVWLYCSESGGHEGNAAQAQQAEEFAVQLRFLQKYIG